MSEDTVARFGRWSFYAGWALGLILGAFADLFDWPLWMTCLASVGIGYAMRWATDAIAEHIAGPKPPYIAPMSTKPPTSI